MKNNPVPDASISLDVVAPTNSEREREYVKRPILFRRWLWRLLWHVVVRQFTLLCVVALVVAGWFGRRRRRLLPGEGCEIMLTGRFDSDNWILAHLSPLSASKKCSRLWMVSTNPVPEITNVVAIYPHKWLTKVVGVTYARLLTFLWAAMWKRPHVVCGFHLIVNGIVAAIVGRLVGAQSMYFCVGGPSEVRDGGVHNEGGILTKMETVDAVVEKRLIDIVSSFDTVITMGTRAVDFFRDKGIDSNFYIVSGGIDSARFRPADKSPSFDFIMTGRLTHIKRIDVFLQAIRYVVKKLPEVKAVIVGNGKLRDELRLLSVDLGIDHNISFVGHQSDVENYLRRSKIFILTSDSEGLSLSMIEAMMCGLPVVVSDVGDLADLVEDGVNGFLVPRGSPKLFAARMVELLSDTQKLIILSKAARYSALRYTAKAATEKWDNIIEQYRTS